VRCSPLTLRSRAIQQQLTADDAAAVASHGVVKEPTVPACRVGDSACDPEDDVNGYCCPEGTITGGSSIENVCVSSLGSSKNERQQMRQRRPEAGCWGRSRRLRWQPRRRVCGLA
jgi:hypothetical protein